MAVQLTHLFNICWRRGKYTSIGEKASSSSSPRKATLSTAQTGEASRSSLFQGRISAPFSYIICAVPSPGGCKKNRQVSVVAAPATSRSSLPYKCHRTMRQISSCNLYQLYQLQKGSRQYPLRLIVGDPRALCHFRSLHHHL